MSWIFNISPYSTIWGGVTKIVLVGLEWKALPSASPQNNFCRSVKGQVQYD